MRDKKKIKEILEHDGVIAFVTDTVWGIGCLPPSKKAVERIYEIKKRDKKKPLILMSDDIQHLRKYVKPLSLASREIIDKYFPGAVTLVVNKSDNTPNYITSKLETVGIRVPANKTFANICKLVDGHTLATTSANISSEPPALSYDEAIKYMGDKVDYIVEDYGEMAQGHASTVVGVSPKGIQIFRQGDIVINVSQYGKARF